MAIGNWREEFADFDPATMPPEVEQWDDGSWGAEPCPHFYTPGGHAVWVDYLDREARGLTDLFRFTVYACDENGAHLTEEPALATDDWSAVLAFIVEVEKPAADLVEACEGFNCTACGRPESECSADPCAAVQADREEAASEEAGDPDTGAEL